MYEIHEDAEKLDAPVERTCLLMVFRLLAHKLGEILGAGNPVLASDAPGTFSWT